MNAIDYSPVVTLAMDNGVSAAELLVVLRDHVRSRAEHINGVPVLPAFASTADGRTRLHESPGARVLPGGLVDQLAKARERDRAAARTTMTVLCAAAALVILAVAYHMGIIP